MTNIYDKTIRKWIHRFNDYGVKGIFTEIDYSGMIKISEKDKKDIICIASTNPRILGLKFSTWSLMTIAGYVKEKKMIQQDNNNNSISHTTVRDILREHSIEWRHSKTVLAESNDPEYDLKKAHR